MLDHLADLTGRSSSIIRLSDRCVGPIKAVQANSVGYLFTSYLVVWEAAAASPAIGAPTLGALSPCPFTSVYQIINELQREEGPYGSARTLDLAEDGDFMPDRVVMRALDAGGDELGPSVVLQAIAMAPPGGLFAY